MPLIVTDQPSTGKTISISKRNLGTSWETLLEANSFSIPLTADSPAHPIEGEPDRDQQGGEMFIGAPILVTNKNTNDSCTIQMRIILECSEDNPADNSNFAIAVTPVILISKAESIQIPLQGLTLLKADFENGYTYGMRLQARAGQINMLDIYGSAVESAYADHATDGDAL